MTKKRTVFYKNLIIAVYLVVIVLPGMLACGGKKENPSKERIAKEAEEPEKAEKAEKSERKSVQMSLFDMMADKNEEKEGEEGHESV